jgi:hypothetical protein
MTTMTIQKRITAAAAGAVLLLFGLTACDFDWINTDPDNPTVAPLESVLPNATMNVVFSLTGADPGWYSSVLVQHTAGVHAQIHNADRLIDLLPPSLNNSWNNLYATILKDLDYVIEVGSATDDWNYVGIAKVLKAYSFQYATDLWGRIPYSEATKGLANLKPKYDDQQAIYQDLQRLLDEAIVDLGKASVRNAGKFDLIHNGNAGKWIRTAYALKARMHNRLSKRDAAGSATAALAAVAQSYTNAADDLTFRGYTTSATAEHPWFQERNDRAHHAWGKRMDDLMVSLGDPRRAVFAQPMPATHAQAGQIIPAPNASADLDQAGGKYSKLSTNIVRAEAPQPLITYAELMLIKADALERLNRHGEARDALAEGIRAAMVYGRVAAADADTYVAAPGVIPADNAELKKRIAEEKWVMLFPFQAAEAFAEWRRTNVPALTNPHGTIPRRMPLAQREYDTNSENAPTVPLGNGVWWDDGTED